MDKNVLSKINALSVIASKYVMFGNEDSFDNFIVTSSDILKSVDWYYSCVLTVASRSSFSLAMGYLVSKKNTSYKDSSNTKEILNYVCTKALTNVNYRNLLTVWFLLRFTDNLYCLSRVKTLILDSISLGEEKEPDILNVYPNVYRFVLTEYLKASLAGESFNDLHSVDFVYMLENALGQSDCISTSDAFAGAYTGSNSLAARVINYMGNLKDCYVCDREQLYLCNCSNRYSNEVIFLACAIPNLFTKEMFYKRLLSCNLHVYSAAVRNPIVSYILNVGLWNGTIE